MSGLAIFLWASLGSVAIEIVRFNSYLLRTPIRIPVRYAYWQFYVGRLLLALLAGGIAMAYPSQTPLLALNIGAATPLIVLAFAKQQPDP